MEGVDQPLSDLIARECADCGKKIERGYVHQSGQTGTLVHVVVVCGACNAKRKKQR